jgi:ABC-2 type transport system ATP-binding protein
MSKEIAIEVKNLSKHFRLPVEQARGIKQAVINRLQGIKGYKDQSVLRDISFTVERGDFFGIVGRNGSGKSTLLKLISNIYNPDSGTVAINGSLVSFIELGVGFNPELTGRENVYLNGALLGFSTSEIDEMYDDIVDFAELGEFMDQKLKNYSSGMQVRLAFSCAIRAKSDILVLDEVLAVGDEAFQRKCNNYFEKMAKDKNQTIVLVTHSMEAVKKYCNKAILLDDGLVAISGDPDKVADQYSIENLNIGNQNHKEIVKQKIKLEVRLSGKPVIVDDKLVLDVSYKMYDSTSVYCGIAIQYFGATIVVCNTKQQGIITADKNSHEFRFGMSLENLNKGEYRILAFVLDDNTDTILQSFGYDNELLFKIGDKKTGRYGMLIDNGKFVQIK